MPKIPTPTQKGFVRTLNQMSRTARRQDDDLRRYFAYRCHVWKRETGKGWKDLAALIHVKPPEISALKNGKSSSLRMLANLAAALGPASSDNFKQLAHEWAEKYPDWEPPTEPEQDAVLPSPITHTGDPLLDGTSGGTSVYSESFRDAARALTGLAKCSVDQARQAAEMAWAANPHHEDTSFGWVALMRPHVERLLKGSGERPSVKVAAAPKTGDLS